MSHIYLLELYEYLGRRKRETLFKRLASAIPPAERKAAEGAEGFLADAMDFLSANYHGKLPKRLRTKHPPEGYLAGE